MGLKYFLIIILSFLFSGLITSQTIPNPNFSLKSHETLEIKKIETGFKETVIFMSVENRREGGSFCADKNIFIIYPDGSRSKMISSSGIPNCPSAYKFKRTGEKLDFNLTFSPLKKGTEWIDLVEECSENCFWFYGLTLDPDLNKRIEEAFSEINNADPLVAMNKFINIIEETDSKDLGSEGLIYLNIINLAKKAGDNSKVMEWYNRFRLSGAPRLSVYIKFLNDQGIR